MYHHKKPKQTIPGDRKQNSFNCTTDWFVHALETTSSTPCQLFLNQIMNLEIKPFFGGFSGPLLHRLYLTYSELDATGPATMVAKYCCASSVPSLGLVERAMLPGVETMLVREAEFYRNILPNLPGSIQQMIPKIYLALLDDCGRRNLLFRTFFDSRVDTRALLVMEDLQGMKGHPVGHKFEKDKDDVMVKKVLSEIATFHAFYWNKSPVQNPPAIYDMMFCTSKMGIRLCNFLMRNPEKLSKKLEKWKSVPSAPKVFNQEDWRENFEVLARVYREIIYPYLTKPELYDLFRHRTFLHGDFHVANVFISDDEKTSSSSGIKLIDWQGYGRGSPAMEITYFLNLSVKFDPTWDVELLKYYHERLTSEHDGHGVLVCKEMYPFDEFQREVMVSQYCLAVCMVNFLQFEDVQNRSARYKQNEKLAILYDLGPLMIQNSLERVFHTTSSRPDLKRFILGNE
eukprot:TRINITY_DN5130_c0_g1_i4.p1 TRINITY_DN5130_c0_g1~~TRINITY_DN5130_c0_g1_i4.p1  ORF type:complete len:521 (-),score=100.41 TRINITY_DN5130_c0_g1_i4:466-1836(-)